MTKEIKVILQWKEKEFLAVQKLDMTKRMALGTLEVEKLIKVSFGAGGPSAPGQPPHVQTGRLRASISSNWTGSGMAQGRVGAKAEAPGMANPEGRWPLIIGTVGTNVEYGYYLEIGTSKIERRPYLRPALEKSFPALKRIFGVR